ncbi:pollen-specific leucine-rich repeat extensin-like protein 1 [Mangifera indica]|uniref:pollen-specific leucine-rich repeat extensin-like protein 1 n=1 Tax=Mangifera indica TaxID=29780 RepID=UPI001CF9316C|nr:pollen-specific leucine-rich repeat extensin-like protein 1 [Mangifera indica]XP_044468742.1 pollen-specific leucine-rich repeat extensin-like protein 1 [Mangifera indica]
MRGLKIVSWFYIIFFLSFTIWSLEARDNETLQSAVVVGTVYCDTCFQEDFSKPSHFISGASVAVECKDETSKPSFRQEVKTDKHGEFKVHLPFSVGKHVRRIKRCSVKLISSSEPYCAMASSATSSSLRLKARTQGTHIFSAGFFSFKPLKQPNLCNQKPSLENAEKINTKKDSLPPINEDLAFPPPIQDPSTPGLPQLDPNILPPLPFLPRLPPLPGLPPLPPLPVLPYLPPLPGKKTTEKNPEELTKITQTQLSESQQKEVDHPDFFLPLPPNPFVLPPVLPTNPFQLPTLSPPNHLGPPSLFNPFPPFPGLTPPSPLSFPFPQFPFLPSPPPRIRRFPPAFSSP